MFSLLFSAFTGTSAHNNFEGKVGTEGESGDGELCNQVAVVPEGAPSEPPADISPHQPTSSTHPNQQTTKLPERPSTSNAPLSKSRATAIDPIMDIHPVQRPTPESPAKLPPCNCRALEHELVQVRQENHTLRTNMDALKTEYRYLGQHNTQLRHDAGSMKKRIFALETELRCRDETIATLRTQTAGVRTAYHQFLELEDRCSGADVIAHVEALNYHILQMALVAAEWLTAHAGGISSEGDENLTPKEAQDSRDALKHILSTGFIVELGHFRHADNPGLLQIAFRAALCEACRTLVSVWSRGAIVGASGPLSVIYNVLKQNEPQAVSARWRALTHGPIKQLSKDNPEVAGFIRGTLKDALLHAAITARFRSVRLLHGLACSLETKLATIEECIQHIRDSIYLDIVSADMELTLVSSGQEFDLQHMRDGFDAEDASGEVACTTELGLSMSKKVVRDGDSTLEQSTLLKPQVFLESSLVELVI